MKAASSPPRRPHLLRRLMGVLPFACGEARSTSCQHSLGERPVASRRPLAALARRAAAENARPMATLIAAVALEPASAEERRRMRSAII